MEDELEKCCTNCKYNYGTYACDIKDKETHCFKCHVADGYSCFLSKDSEYPKTRCIDCIHYSKSPHDSPCSECFDYSNLETKEEPRKKKKSEGSPFVKSCKNCKYSSRSFFNDEPCCSCNTSYSEFAPKVVLGEEPRIEIVDDIEGGMEQEADELKNELTKAVESFSCSFSPCKLCDNYQGGEQTSCDGCCYYYPSKFKLRGAK